MKSFLRAGRLAMWHLRDRVLGVGTERRARYDNVVRALKLSILRRFPRFEPYLFAPVSPAQSTAPETSLPGVSMPPAPAFHAWWMAHAAGPDELERMRANRGAWPRVTVIMLETGSPVGFDRTLVSLQEQVYPEWELLVQPASARSARARAEERLRLVDLRHLDHDPSPGEWVRIALQQATAPFCLLMRPGDILAPDALWHMARRVGDGDVDVLYTDEDRVGADAFHTDPVFRPDFGFETFLSMPGFGAAWLVRRTVALAVPETHLVQPTATATDAALAVGVVAQGSAIAHLPRILVHRRSVAAATDPATDAAIRQILAQAAARGTHPATATPAGPGRYHVRRPLTDQPRVAIIIPTRDRIDLLRACIDSIETISTYKHLEIIIVDNGSIESASHAYFAEVSSRHRVIADPRPFNWPALNNAAARATDAPVLLFLNNDIEVVAPDWLEAMLEHIEDPGVGVVGARLLYPDGRLQHAGVVVGIGDHATHAFHRMAADGREYMGFASITRNWSAVTGACMMVRHSVFDAVGGFDEALPVVYNDIDFCLRVGQEGLRTVCTPHATLIHLESLTRGSLHPREDADLFRARWLHVIESDPHFNPNLSRWHSDFRPRLPDSV